MKHCQCCGLCTFASYSDYDDEILCLSCALVLDDLTKELRPFAIPEERGQGNEV